MSKLLYESKFSINQFSGGKERGMCIQITDENGYVQLTEDEVKALIKVLKKWVRE